MARFPHGARARSARASATLPPALRATLAGVALAAGASACATAANTAAAGRLATQGASVARTSETSLAAVRPQLERYIEGLYLAAPLTGRTPPTPATFQAVSRIADAMDARAQVMAQLASAYDSFDALASYGAPDSAAAGLAGLTGAVNTYADRLGLSPTPISAGADRALGIATRQIVGRVQQRMLVESSRALRERVQQVRALMQREMALYDGIAQEMITGRRTNVVALYSLHLLTPSGILADQVDDYGLVLDSARVARFPDVGAPTQRKNLDDAVQAVLFRRASRRVDAQRALLRATVSGFDALIAAHQAFEREAPFSPAGVAAQIAVMQTYMQQLQPSAPSPASDTPAGGKSP